MTTVMITGGYGFLSWHLRSFLHAQTDVSVVLVGRAETGTREKFAQTVISVDTIVHLAGVNRGNDDDVETGNISVAYQLASAIGKTNKPLNFIFANSTHRARDTPYGRSKSKSAETLKTAVEASGGVFTDLVLPHVFGEGGKPFYNSAVATFCFQLATSQVPVVEKDAELELVHAQVAASIIARHILTAPTTSQEIRVEGTEYSVSELLRRLTELSDLYSAGIFSDLSDSFTLDLFNTYRSYLFPDYYPKPIAKKTDVRGSLIETVKGGGGGQTFVSTSYPDQVRGNHFHLHKVERFVVLEGEANIGLRRLFSNQIINFKVSGDSPMLIDMPTMYVHNLTNIGSGQLTTLFWTHEIFDPSAPDTYPELVAS